MADRGNSKKKIAVIGDSDFRIGFELAGVQKSFDNENYEEKIKDLTERNDIGILVTDEKDLEDLPERILQKVEGSVSPVVVSLSKTAESERLQEKIKKAIGADITQ